MGNQPKNIKASDFKDRFDQESNSDLGWNNPPDFLFEDAINSVNNQNKKKRKSMLFFLLAGIILLGIFVNQYYFANRIENLESQVEKISATSLKKESTSPVNINVAPVSEELKVEEVKAEVAIETSVNGYLQKDIIDEDITTSITNISEPEANPLNQSFYETKQSGTVSVSANTKLQRQHIERTSTTNPSDSTPKEGVSNSLLSAVSALPSITAAGVSSLRLEYNPLLVSLDRVPDVKTIAADSDLTAQLGLRLERNISTLIMTAPLGAQNLTLYDNYYNGIGLQVDYSMPLSSKLDMISSVSYRKISNESLAENTLSYQKGTEVMMPGQMAMYEMDNEIESPLGTLEERMQLVVDPSTTQDGDALHQSISLDQCISVIGLASGFSYKLLDNSKLTWAASVQPSLNIILGMESKMHSHYEMHDIMMGESEVKLEEANNTRKLYGSLNLGSSISYKLSRDYQLSFGGGYQRGLSSLRQDMTSSSRTYLSSWTSYIGLSKSF